MHREAGLIQADFAARIGQNYQVVVGRFFLELALAIWLEFLLRDVLGALYVGELLNEFRDLVVGAADHLVQGRRGGERHFRRQGEEKDRYKGLHSLRPARTMPLHCTLAL